MKSYKSQSTEIPTEWDLTSSPTTVYHNTNITSLSKVDENDIQMYEYNVDEYTKEEYQNRVIAQARADIDYLSAMTGVEI